VKAAPWICIVTHVAALVALALYLRPGTQIAGDATARAKYVSAFLTPWTFGWATWMASAAALVGFYAWWGARSTGGSPVPYGSRRQTFIATAAVIIAAFGMVCDFAGEASLILRLVEYAASDLIAFAHIERQFTLLSAAAANGLYTVGGILLTLITTNLPRWVRWAMWITWAAGAAMTFAAFADFVPGLVISTAVLFPLFLVWVAWLGARWSTVSSVEQRPA